MVGTACTPWWNTEGLECPFGYKISFFDVTVPNHANFFDVLAVIYGMVPYIAAFFLFFRFCWNRGTQELGLGFCLLFTVIINEFLIKNQIDQRRPGQSVRDEIITKVLQDNGAYEDVARGTCNTSCGMPSSHSVIALAFFVLMATDAFGTYLLRANEPMWFFVWMIAYSFVYLPVPVSRVVLWDHTSEQAFLGSLIGTIIAGFWTFGMQFLNNKWTPKYDEPLLMAGKFVVFRHNLPPSFLHTPALGASKEASTLQVVATDDQPEARRSEPIEEGERKESMMRGTADTTADSAPAETTGTPPVETPPAENGAQLDADDSVP